VAEKTKSRNPFYVLLVIVGIAFVVSACAYGFMAYSDVMLIEGGPSSGSRLMQFMDQHGMKLLVGEVLLLGLFTVGAIGTDEYWQRRATNLKENSHESDAHN
jgi:hypothetical protein